MDGTKTLLDVLFCPSLEEPLGHGAARGWAESARASRASGRSPPSMEDARGGGEGWQPHGKGADPGFWIGDGRALGARERARVRQAAPADIDDVELDGALEASRQARSPRHARARARSRRSPVRGPRIYDESVQGYGEILPELCSPDPRRGAQKVR